MHSFEIENDARYKNKGFVEAIKKILAGKNLKKPYWKIMHQ